MSAKKESQNVINSVLTSWATMDVPAGVALSSQKTARDADVSIRCHINVSHSFLIMFHYDHMFR